MDITKESITNLEMNTVNEDLVAVYPNGDDSALVIFKRKDAELHGAVYLTKEGCIEGEKEPIVVFKKLILEGV